MKTYIYDGSFEGFLSCVFDVLKSKENPSEIVSLDKKQNGLFVKELYIDTSLKKADLCMNFFKNRFSSYSARHIYFVYLSSAAGKEMRILQYIKLGLKKGKCLDRFLTDDRVLSVHKISQKVACEAHRMKGLLRFKELENGELYAAMSTDHFVLPLLCPFFAQRLKKMQWVIHDIKRRKAALYKQNLWDIVDILESREPQYSAHENNCQEFWKRYFQKIAIKDRKNEKLQRNNMPKRYWKHLVEMQ
jgi:probable DNA metabolism protein